MKRIILIYILSLQAHADDRPPWTERTSYVDGARVYFVGVSTAKATIEDAREGALKHAKSEALTWIGADEWPETIDLNTQVTFEDHKPDGFRCFRLAYIEIAEAKAWKVARDRQTQGADVTPADDSLNLTPPRPLKQSCSGRAVKRDGKVSIATACSPNMDGPAKDALINEIRNGGLPYMLHHCSSHPIANINGGEPEEFVTDCI